MALNQHPLMSSLCCFILFLLFDQKQFFVFSRASSINAPSTRAFWRQRRQRETPSSWNSSPNNKSNCNDSQSHNTQQNETHGTLLQQQQNATIPTWKRLLPEPLCSRSSTLERILIPFHDENDEQTTASLSFVEVYLLGTAHVSTDSCEDVRLLLQHARPQVIFLELCEQRMGMVLATTTNESMNNNHTRNNNHTNNETSQPQEEVHGKNMTFWQKVHCLRQEQSHMSKVAAMATVLLTQAQEECAKSLGVELGGEFRVAYQYYLTRLAQNQQQPQRKQESELRIVLGDRPLFLTLRRSWNSLNGWDKFRLVCALLWSSLRPVPAEELKQWMKDILESGQTDVLTESIAELNQTFPTLVTTIIDERNAYMACKLYQTCGFLILQRVAWKQEQRIRGMHQQQPSSVQPSEVPNNKKNITVVAIVGAGHVQGMVEWFTNGYGKTPEVVLRELVQTTYDHDRNKWWQPPWRKKNKKTQTQNEAVYNEEQRHLIEDVIELQQPSDQ
jgi:pheromone shutdown protein TraB